MLFNSFEFALFLPVVFALYWISPFRWQNRLLLVASYVFYGAWDWRFLGLLALSTVIDYSIGRRLAVTNAEGARKRLLMISLASNFSILGFFKYYGFFVDSAIGFLGWFGLEPNPPLLQVLLPVGISFYTFQTISYSFDVYRRRIEPADNLWDFATFVAFFPQLVAGPIERARDLLPQLQRPRPRLTVERFKSGAYLILLGLFKKIAIADVAAQVANQSFGTVDNAGSVTLLLGMLAFALQIYGDFSGYSDVARGTSRLLGIELIRNFEQPYLSRNITEFWRTWHISLSNWLHDYLYVPLGGNRGGKLFTYRNLLVTMLLGGLWHGAAWTFVIWGGLHGLALAAHRAVGGYAPRGQPSMPRWRDLPAIVATFGFVIILWVFFRAVTLEEAFTYLARLFSGVPGAVDPNAVVLVAVCGLAVLAIDVGQRFTQSHTAVLRLHPVFRGATCALFLLAIVLWSGGEAQPFIYFQF